MRNRYVGRTFIEGTADRAAKARLKYTPLAEVLQGKRVLLVEDSIVRSTTMRALVHEIRDRGGAREIHLRVACPPIIAPCYYGIDMSSKDELFATRFVDLPGGGVSEQGQEEMARELGADSLRYLPVEAIARSVTLSPERLCRACITGQYPTEAGHELYRIETGSCRPSSGNRGPRAYETLARS
jgi:amidophosphoribosyltransferase